jgi:hypothetical protein
VEIKYALKDFIDVRKYNLHDETKSLKAGPSNKKKIIGKSTRVKPDNVQKIVDKTRRKIRSNEPR